MARGPVTPEKIKTRIGETFVMLQVLRGNSIKKVTAKEVLQALKKDRKIIDKKLIPGERAIQGHIKRLTENLTKVESVETDRPWTVAATTEYPMSPESVALMIQIQGTQHRNGLLPIPIRVALWIDRLRAVKFNDSHELLEWSSMYAAREWIADATNLTDGKKGFDTSDLDETLSYVLWYRDNPEEYKKDGSVWEQSVETLVLPDDAPFEAQELVQRLKRKIRAKREEHLNEG